MLQNSYPGLPDQCGPGNGAMERWMTDGAMLLRERDTREVDGGGRAEGAGSGDRPPVEAASWQIRESFATRDDSLLRALETLTQLHERPTSGQALGAGLPLPPDGLMTPALAPRALERAGLSARLVRRAISAIDALSMPCILFLKDRRCVVLVERRGAVLRVVVPETGRGTVEVELADLERRYDGHALFARPEIGYEQRDRPIAEERKGHWFWSTLLRQWPTYAEVMIAAVMINAFALASPLFVMNVYDRVVPNNALDTLWVLALGAFIVFAFDFLLKSLRGYFIDTAGRIADIRLASRIFEQVLGIRMAARPASAGAFANNLREFESLRDFFTSATVTTLVDLPFVLFFITIIWLIGGPVALVPAIAVPVVIGVGLVMQIPLNRVVRRTFKESAAKHGVLVEAINGLETIKSIGAESRLQRGWERYVAATAESANRSRFLSAVTVNVAGLAANLVTVGVVVVGVYRIGEGLMTVGALVACTIIAGRAMAPLGQVAGLLTRYHQARMSYDTLNRVMAMPIERSPDMRFLDRPRLSGAIEFKNVTLTYPGQKLPALSDVGFRLEAGERVGLIGRIGSGKTTIEKLVLGLYSPEKGAVLVDGTDLRQLDPADLRRNIGCVPQDVFLFQGSVRENITMGASFADDAAVLRAAEISGVEDFVSRHPLGYDMPVGERGELLSGGQRQAIALARALLLDPPILILDEPTSAMDNGAESRFKTRLGEELAGRTLLLVTHRASLLGLVDRLIVLDGGRLVADGPRDQVLKALAAGQIKGAN
jgi:ATP-binding cassette subfamily C protein LapB